MSKNKEYYESNIGWVGSSSDISPSVSEKFMNVNNDDEGRNKIFRSHTVPKKVDRHGFVVSHQLHSKVSSLPNPSMTGKIGKRRERKWLDMVNNWEDMVSKKPNKIKERCQKGIPQSFRSLAWQHLSGAIKLQEQNKDLYESLLKNESKTSKWADIIKKDIPRTFRHHCIFYDHNSRGQDDLYKVLLAYSCYNAEIGYNQALAPVAAVLLMHMQPEDTFWVLVSICKYYLPGYYGVKMEAMKLDGLIFGHLLNSNFPYIGKQMHINNIDPLMYIVEWMVCIYARCLPFQTVLRIWDMFFCEGVKVLFKVGLAILKLVFPSSKDLVDKDDFQITQLLNNLPKEYTIETVLIPEALNISITEREFEKVQQKVIIENPDLEISRFNSSDLK